MSSFTPNIPATGQTLLQTRNPIRDNFSTINTTISQDHGAMNGAVQGKHNKSTYVSQASDPSTAASELAVYAKTISGDVRLFGRPPSDGTVYQLLGMIGATVATTGGGCAIGGGFQLRWGSYTQSAGNVSRSFLDGSGSAIPFDNNCFAVFITVVGGIPTATVNVVSFNSSGFTASMNSGTPNHSAMYLAIGN